MEITLFSRLKGASRVWCTNVNVVDRRNWFDQPNWRGICCCLFSFFQKQVDRFCANFLREEKSKEKTDHFLGRKKFGNYFQQRSFRNGEIRKGRPLRPSKIAASPGCGHRKTGPLWERRKNSKFPYPWIRALYHGNNHRLGIETQNSCRVGCLIVCCCCPLTRKTRVGGRFHVLWRCYIEKEDLCVVNRRRRKSRLVVLRI